MIDSILEWQKNMFFKREKFFLESRELFLESWGREPRERIEKEFFLVERMRIGGQLWPLISQRQLHGFYHVTKAM